MGFFLLLITALFIFFLWPLIKIAWQINSVRRQMKQAYGPQQNRNRNSRRESSRKSQAAPKKKIDSNVGEYIDYEEVIVDRNEEIQRQYRSASIQYRKQQQVSDAEWEEMK